MLARQAREEAVLESQQSSDGSREETLRRLGEGRPCHTSPGMPCLKCSRSHRVFAAEKRNGRIQQKEAARARKGLAEDEHAAPKAQCALHPSLETHPPTHAPDALWPRYVKSDVLLLKSIFDALDRDRSGTVQVPDLREALKQQQDSLRRVDRHNLADLEPVCPCLLPLPPPPPLPPKVCSGCHAPHLAMCPRRSSFFRWNGSRSTWAESSSCT